MAVLVISFSEPSINMYKNQSGIDTTNSAEIPTNTLKPADLGHGSWGNNVKRHRSKANG